MYKIISLFSLFFLLILFTTACAAPNTYSNPSETSEQTVKNTVTSAEKISTGMTAAQVTDLLGIDGQLLHAHVYVNKWEIDNGQLLYVWFYSNSESPDTSVWNYNSDWIVGGYQLTDTWKDYPGDYRPTAEDASKIHEGMSFDAMIDTIGPGGKSVGSGHVIYRWIMNDGRFLLVWINGDVQSTQIVDKDYQTFVNDEDVDKIEIGMTYEEVFHLLDECDMVVCTDAELYQYPLTNNSYVLIWYRDIDGEKTVCNVEIVTSDAL